MRLTLSFFLFMGIKKVYYCETSATILETIYFDDDLIEIMITECDYSSGKSIHLTKKDVENLIEELKKLLIL